MFGATSNPEAPEATAMGPHREVVLLSGGGPEADALTDLLHHQGKVVRSQLLPSDTPLPEADAHRIVNAQAVIWQGGARRRGMLLGSTGRSSVPTGE